MLDSVNEVNTDKIISYMKSLQNENGSFKGDYAGEVDARFSYCAVSALALLNSLDSIDKEKCADFILKC